MKMREHMADSHKESPKKMPDIRSYIRSYIVAVLLLLPTISVQSEDISKAKKDAFVNIYEQRDFSGESAESMISYEKIFKDGIKKALNGLNSIDKIPVGGQPIYYYRDDGSLKGKQIRPESVKALGLPDKFDINPKTVTTSVPSMVLTLGNRKFDISPDLCNIKNIFLTKNELVIETTLLFNITYDKQEKLPNLLLRLRMTPKGKGEKEGFKATTVTEL